ncbi:hypothetical protein ROGSH02058M1_p21700 (plasmid) [Raoultella ornithinolytica]|nr:hypothetical protein ROGSH02058M1_p21700 [Raoultella ornithinolytica]BBT88214.1 hypothetical protein WP8W19C01_P21630 [Raoultella ornithinolytica]
MAQDRPPVAIISGQGGAAGQRERVAELTMMAREQGRDVQIIAADEGARAAPLCRMSASAASISPTGGS